MRVLFFLRNLFDGATVAPGDALPLRSGRDLLLQVLEHITTHHAAGRRGAALEQVEESDEEPLSGVVIPRDRLQAVEHVGQFADSAHPQAAAGFDER